MTWLAKARGAFASRKDFLEAIETKDIDGEGSAYNEDLLPTSPGEHYVLYEC